MTVACIFIRGSCSKDGDAGEVIVYRESEMNVVDTDRVEGICVPETWCEPLAVRKYLPLHWSLVVRSTKFRVKVLVIDTFH